MKKISKWDILEFVNITFVAKKQTYFYKNR